MFIEFTINNSHVQLYCDEFQRVCEEHILDNSIDVIATDPPYPREFMYLYKDLGEVAKRKLVDGGSLLAIVPQYSLPQILELVNPNLKYRWICSMWQEKGMHARMAMGIEVMWKPVVWWVKRAYKTKRGFVKDGFDNKPTDKKYFNWEQSEDWSDYCCRFVKPGENLLDPMMGSGVMAVSCINKGVNFIGIEKDIERYEMTLDRINKEYGIHN